MTAHDEQELFLWELILKLDAHRERFNPSVVDFHEMKAFDEPCYFGLGLSIQGGMSRLLICITIFIIRTENVLFWSLLLSSFLLLRVGGVSHGFDLLSIKVFN